MASTAITRIAAPTAATAIVTTTLAIVVNLATGSVHSIWLWAAVAVLTLLSFAVSMWLHHQNAASPTEPARGLRLTRSKARNVNIGNVRSPGDGIDITRSKLLGDLTAGDITTGPDQPPTP